MPADEPMKGCRRHAFLRTRRRHRYPALHAWTPGYVEGDRPSTGRAYRMVTFETNSGGDGQNCPEKAPEKNNGRRVGRNYPKLPESESKGDRAQMSNAAGFTNSWVQCPNCEQAFPAFAVGRERYIGFKARCWNCRHVGQYTCDDLQFRMTVGSRTPSLLSAVTLPVV